MSSTSTISAFTKIAELSQAGKPAEAIKYVAELIKNCCIPSFVPLLPALLNLRGRPFSLDNHCQFEPLFSPFVSKSTVYKTARQLGKSYSMSASAIVLGAVVPDFRIAFITPLFTQVQRISNEVVRPFLTESPIGKLMRGKVAQASVLRQMFSNRSRLEFTFASLSADRIRGASNDLLNIDEIQDFRQELLPVVGETLSASPYALIRKFGTPKTPENTIEGEWRQSSQAEWCVPCKCGKKNYAALSLDLERMIGPWREDISFERPGTICAKCGDMIHPNLGYWVHRYPERRAKAAGYHLPQPIMHLHYSNPDKWAELHRKRDGIGSYTPAKYQNEVLGESAGEGLQLVTEEDLRRACDESRPNIPKEPRRHLNNLDKYKHRFLAVDWGGGGESGVSLTVPVVLGQRQDNGRIDVLYSRRLYTPNDHLLEARQVLELYNMFKCHRIVHDFTGAGALRETVLASSGVNRRQLVPIQYVGSAQTALMAKVKPTGRAPRVYFRLNKSRSLLYTCAAIRTGALRFFKYDNRGTDDPGLINDFLALYEERIEHKSGSNVYLIARNHSQTDDFAQAVNIGCAALWYASKSWPKFTVDPKFDISQELASQLEPENPWDAMGQLEGTEDGLSDLE